MAETELLVRAQEEVGNDPLPEPVLLHNADDDALNEEFASRSREIVDISRKGMARLEELISRVRAHPDNEPGESFRELGPLLSKRIERREGQLAQLVTIDMSARRINDPEMKRLHLTLAKVITQLGHEHRLLVTLFYHLKTEADEVAGDTHGGPVLKTEADIDRFFDEHIAAG
jgi:hypothetical protein